MRKKWIVLLAAVAVVCLGVALNYPVQYLMARYVNERQLDELRQIRRQALEGTEGTQAGLPEDVTPEGNNHDADSRGEGEDRATAAAVQPAADDSAPREAFSEPIMGLPSEESRELHAQTPGSGEERQPEDGQSVAPGESDGGQVASSRSEDGQSAVSGGSDGGQDALSRPEDGQSAVSGGTDGGQDTSSRPEEGPSANSAEDEVRVPGPLSYYDKTPVSLDPERILPQYQALYRQNQDLVGWLLIEELGIDYPVMQTPRDETYYLHRDFFGRYNFNGQLILDADCDPYTPSYNLIIYGHNMRNGTMFGALKNYAKQEFWAQHRLVEFDSLMERRQYVVVAVFYSAEYVEGQPGFRYALDFRDEGEYNEWMRQVKSIAEYDTGIDCAFGDEFITLSTCAYHVKNGRFAIVARRLRAGETPAAYAAEP